MENKGVSNVNTDQTLYNKYTLKEKIKGMGPGILVVGTFLGPGSITSATLQAPASVIRCCGLLYFLLLL